MLKEFVSLLRGTHLLVITLSAATILFAVSPRDSVLYARAKAEIDILRSLKLEEYLKYAAKLVEDDLETTRKFFRDFLSKHQNRFPVATEFGYSTGLGINWPTAKSTVKEYESFFAGDNTVLSISQVIDAQIPKAFDAALKNSFGGTCTDYNTEKQVPCPSIVGSAGYELSSVSFRLQEAPADATINKFQLVYRKIPSPPDNKGVMEFLFSEPNGGGASALADIAIGTFLLKQGKLAQDWLKTRPREEQALVMLSEQRTIVFPQMKEIWDEISNMTTEEAARYMETRIRDTRRLISLFGLSIDERILIITAPALIFSLELYLLANTNMFLIALRRATVKLEAAPWIGLSDDFFSKVVTTLSVIVAPVASIFLLLWLSGHWDTADAIVAEVSGVGALACGSGEIFLLNTITKSFRPARLTG